MKIHTGDHVTVISGKDKGKQGTVTRVLPDDHRVIVEGINMRTRHIKKTPQQAGQRISYEASIHVSNVMILDPKTKKPTRIGYTIDPKTGRKSRIAKASGEVITKATVKAEKPPKAKSQVKSAKVAEGAEGTQVAKKADMSAAKPIKQPFWKRKGDAKGQESGKGQEGGGTAFTTAHRSQGG